MPFSNVDECQLARNGIRPSGMEVPEPVQMDVKSLAQPGAVYLHGIRLISTPGSWSCGSHGSRSASLCFRCFRRGNFIPGGFVIRGIPFRNARFSFFRNQRPAASFSIHSASSFTLRSYLAWRLRKFLPKSNRLLIINSAKRLSSAKSIPSFSTCECDTFYTMTSAKKLAHLVYSREDNS